MNNDYEQQENSLKKYKNYLKLTSKNIYLGEQGCYWTPYNF